MMKRTIRFRVQDQPVRRGSFLVRDDRNRYRRVGGHRVRDELLSPVYSGKLHVAARTWEGDLKPKIDAAIAAVEPLITGLTSGNVLHAEPGPADLNLGRQWLGDLRSRLADAVMEHARSGGGSGEAIGIDLSAVLQAAARLDEVFETGGRNPAQLSSAFDALRRARDAVMECDPAEDPYSTRQIGDAGRHPGIRGWSRPIGGFGRQTSPASINRDNRAYWEKRTADQLASLAPAAGTRGALERTISRGGASGAKSIADINKANAEFWRGR